MVYHDPGIQVEVGVLEHLIHTQRTETGVLHFQAAGQLIDLVRGHIRIAVDGLLELIVLEAVGDGVQHVGDAAHLQNLPVFAEHIVHVVEEQNLQSLGMDLCHVQGGRLVEAALCGMVSGVVVAELVDHGPVVLIVAIGLVIYERVARGVQGGGEAHGHLRVGFLDVVEMMLSHVVEGLRQRRVDLADIRLDRVQDFLAGGQLVKGFVVAFHGVEQKLRLHVKRGDFILYHRVERAHLAGGEIAVVELLVGVVHIVVVAILTGNLRAHADQFLENGNDGLAALLQNKGENGVGVAVVLGGCFLQLVLRPRLAVVGDLAVFHHGLIVLLDQSDFLGGQLQLAVGHGLVACDGFQMEIAHPGAQGIAAGAVQGVFESQQNLIADLVEPQLRLLHLGAVLLIGDVGVIFYL